MADASEMAIESAVTKLGFLANMFSQQGDLVLTEQDKAGLTCILENLITDLSKPQKPN